MLTLYFSGTGNTRFVADNFSKKTDAECHSIEEDLDFGAAIARHERICFSYPIYGSCVPRIMEDFVRRHRSALIGKEFVILCTQLLFSGDGARTFTDLLKGVDHRVVYAAHINMPNNICNVPILPVAGPERIEKYKRNALTALDRISDDLRRGVVHRKGFNSFSMLLGLLTHRLYFRSVMPHARKSVRVSPACNLCLQCVRACPVQNLKAESGRIVPKDNCTLCYRCVNLCPKKAITVLIHGKVRRQYEGVEGQK